MQLHFLLLKIHLQVRCEMKGLICSTSFLMPPCCLTVRLALLNLATLAMVSAARHLRSLSGSRKILTMVCRPPRSAMARRIWVFLEISFKILSDPIWKWNKNLVLNQASNYHCLIVFHCNIKSTSPKYQNCEEKFKRIGVTCTTWLNHCIISHFKFIPCI